MSTISWKIVIKIKKCVLSCCNNILLISIITLCTDDHNTVELSNQ